MIIRLQSKLIGSQERPKLTPLMQVYILFLSFYRWNSKSSHLFEVAHQSTESIYQGQGKSGEAFTSLSFLDLTACTSLIFLQFMLHFV